MLMLMSTKGSMSTIVEVKVRVLDAVLPKDLLFPLNVDVLDDVDDVTVNCVVHIEVVVKVGLLDETDVNVDLVQEVLVEATVNVIELHVNTVDGVEGLAGGAMRTRHLMLPLLVNVLDDVGANREVDVEVDVNVIDLVLEVLVEVEVEVVEIHVDTIDACNLKWRWVVLIPGYRIQPLQQTFVKRRKLLGLNLRHGEEKVEVVD
eukprot:2162282-Amphidinium_carterae.1